MEYQYLISNYPKTTETLCFEDACDAVTYKRPFVRFLDTEEIISHVWSKPTAIEGLHEIGVSTTCLKSVSCYVKVSDFPYSYLVMYYYVAMVKQLEDAMRNYKEC